MDTETIRAALAKDGKTQRGLAAALRIDPAAVHRLVRGERKLKAAEIVAAARYLELDSADLGDLGQAVTIRRRHPMLVDIGAETFAILPVWTHDAVGIETPSHRTAFREPWLRMITQAPLEKLGMLEVGSDAMEPTLHHGDKVLFDRTQTTPMSSAGIYILDVEGKMVIRRIEGNLITGKLTLRTDNPAYAPLNDIEPQQICVVGKVIWLAHQIAG